jgi:hypothetical protein
MLTNPASPLTEIPEKKSLMADEGTAKIPLHLLPEGLKPGDRFSLTITGVDNVTGTATVVVDNPTNAVVASPKETIDTDLTMGPINDLKSYLYKKTMEQGE